MLYLNGCSAAIFETNMKHVRSNHADDCNLGELVYVPFTYSFEQNTLELNKMAMAASCQSDQASLALMLAEVFVSGMERNGVLSKAMATRHRLCSENKWVNKNSNPY